MNYLIIKTSDLPKINFSQFLDDNENSLTKNIDKTLCILKYEGKLPSSLTDVEIVRFENREFHNHKEIIELKKIVSSNPDLGWVKEIEL